MIVGATCGQLANGCLGPAPEEPVGFRIGAREVPEGPMSGRPGLLVAEACESFALGIGIGRNWRCRPDEPEDQHQIPEDSKDRLEGFALHASNPPTNGWVRSMENPCVPCRASNERQD